MACSPRQALSCAVARVKVLGAWPSAGLCRLRRQMSPAPAPARRTLSAPRWPYLYRVAGALAISAICVCSFAFVLSRCSQRLDPFLVKPLPNMTSRLFCEMCLYLYGLASSFCVVSLRGPKKATARRVLPRLPKPAAARCENAATFVPSLHFLWPNVWQRFPAHPLTAVPKPTKGQACSRGSSQGSTGSIAWHWDDG